MDHLEFQQWADDVTPLLYFDTKLQNQFKQCVRAANISKSLNNSIDLNSNIGRACGIVNQAVTLREIMPIHNSAANPTKDPANSPKNPLSTLHIDTFKTVFGGLVLACLIYLIYTHFDLKLN
jgi:hypothetical protein